MEEENMKKIICILLTVFLLASMSTAAFAKIKAGEPVNYDKNGIKITYTEDFEKMKGTFLPYDIGLYYDGIGEILFFYYALSREEFNILMEKPEDEWTEADKALMRGKQTRMSCVISINEGRGIPEIIELLNEDGDDTLLTEDDFTEIGKAGDTTFYIVDTHEDEEAYLAGIAPAYQEEYVALKEALTECLKKAEFSEPSVPGSARIGQVIHFEGTDLDGNPVSSEDIFKEHEITMVNIWSTWCHNCVKEMTGLGDMSRKLADKNVAVVGICMDADKKPEECRQILKDHNVDFLNLMPVNDLYELLEYDGAFPTSYFFGSDGTLLCRSFKGAPAKMDEYEKVIDSLLKGNEPEVKEPESLRTAPNDAGVYRVFVSDTDGNMVKGAAVQFCSDSTCMMAKTDENGVASFKADEGQIYTIHMLKVPSGYEKNNEEFKTETVYCDIYISLQKAESN